MTGEAVRSFKRLHEADTCKAACCAGWRRAVTRCVSRLLAATEAAVLPPHVQKEALAPRPAALALGLLSPHTAEQASSAAQSLELSDSVQLSAGTSLSHTDRQPG